MLGFLAEALLIKGCVCSPKVFPQTTLCNKQRRNKRNLYQYEIYYLLISGPFPWVLSISLFCFFFSPLFPSSKGIVCNDIVIVVHVQPPPLPSLVLPIASVQEQQLAPSPSLNLNVSMRVILPLATLLLLMEPELEFGMFIFLSFIFHSSLSS